MRSRVLRAVLATALALLSAPAAIVRTPKDRHPYYWAPFMVVGNGS